MIIIKDNNWEEILNLLTAESKELSKKVNKKIYCDDMMVREAYYLTEMKLTEHSGGLSIFDEMGELCYWLLKLKPLHLATPSSLVKIFTPNTTSYKYEPNVDTLSDKINEYAALRTSGILVYACAVKITKIKFNKNAITKSEFNKNIKILEKNNNKFKYNIPKLAQIYKTKDHSSSAISIVLEIIYSQY